MISKPTSSEIRPLILLVDDDPDITRSIATRLSQFDVDVISRTTGMQGISELRRQPDLVITDLTMPIGNGESFISAAKQKTKTSTIPFIVLTGRRDAELELRMKSLGVEGFLNKPVEGTLLLEQIARFVDLNELTAT